MSYTKKALSAVFNAALVASLGAGVVAVLESSAKEQKQWPSLSNTDATRMYHNDIGTVAGFLGAWQIAEALFATRKKSQSTPGPNPS